MDLEKGLFDLLNSQIKNKSQIKDLKDDFINEKIRKYLLRNGDILKRINTEYAKKGDKIIKSKEFKEIVKRIREEIGSIYGCFLTNEFRKKERILENLKSKTEVNKLLKLHKSTRERVNFYKEIYLRIFTWFKENNQNLPKKIADLGCGLNPLSFIYFPKEIDFLFCTDLNPKDMEFLNKCFQKFDIKGIAKPYDLINLEFIKEINSKNIDLVFIFKVLDSLEKIKKNISKEILERITSKNIVVSFPKKSLVSKENFKVKRTWLKKFITEQKWKIEEFEVENELFFLIKK